MEMLDADGNEIQDGDWIAWDAGDDIECPTLYIYEISYHVSDIADEIICIEPALPARLNDAPEFLSLGDGKLSFNEIIKRCRKVFKVEEFSEDTDRIEFKKSASKATYGMNIIDAIVESFPETIKSSSEARRRIQQGAVYAAPIRIGEKINYPDGVSREDMKKYKVDDVNIILFDNAEYVLKVGKLIPRDIARINIPVQYLAILPDECTEMEIFEGWHMRAKGNK